MEEIAGAGEVLHEDAWMDGARTPHFHALINARRRSIIPMAIIYICGYIGLSLLAGFDRELMGMKIYGPINVGYALIAGNYLMAWLVAVSYAWIAAKNHDPLVEILVDTCKKSGAVR